MVEKLLSAKELSERLEINLFTCYSWARSGIIPSVKLGPKLIRFKESDIEKFISAKGAPGHESKKS